MPLESLHWSDQEEQIARRVFDIAYRRELSATLAYVRQVAAAIDSPDALWKLHDFLSAKRHEMDGKYDARPSMLIFVFADLIKNGWISLEELQGLEPEKLTRIAALTRM